LDSIPSSLEMMDRSGGFSQLLRTPWEYLDVV